MLLALIVHCLIAYAVCTALVYFKRATTPDVLMLCGTIALLWPLCLIGLLVGLSCHGLWTLVIDPTITQLQPEKAEE